MEYLDTSGVATSQNQLVLRPIKIEDAEPVTELIIQLGYERQAEEVRRWIAELEGRANVQAVFVACIGDEVEGWIEVSLKRRLQSPEVAFIGGLVVKDGRRGQGIGGSLCERAEAWGREHGATKMQVTSRSSRERAHRFYLRRGYEQVKTSLVFEKTVSEKT